MSLPEGWTLQRTQDGVITVKDPCVSTDVVLHLHSLDRRVRSFYNLCDDLLKPPGQGKKPVEGWNGTFEHAYRLGASSMQESRDKDYYAWPTIEDYERDVEFKVNEVFKMGWNMARTKESMFRAKS